MEEVNTIIQTETDMKENLYKKRCLEGAPIIMLMAIGLLEFIKLGTLTSQVSMLLHREIVSMVTC